MLQKDPGFVVVQALVCLNSYAFVPKSQIELMSYGALPALLPAWVMDTVCPATLKVPVLEDPVLRAREKLMVPLPLPVTSESILIQLSLLRANQRQLLAVVTDTSPYPPQAAKFCEEAVTE